MKISPGLSVLSQPTGCPLGTRKDPHQIYFFLSVEQETDYASVKAIVTDCETYNTREKVEALKALHGMAEDKTDACKFCRDYKEEVLAALQRGAYTLPRLLGSALTPWVNTSQRVSRERAVNPPGRENTSNIHDRIQTRIDEVFKGFGLLSRRPRGVRIYTLSDGSNAFVILGVGARLHNKWIIHPYGEAIADSFRAGDYRCDVCSKTFKRLPTRHERSPKHQENLRKAFLSSLYFTTNKGLLEYARGKRVPATNVLENLARVDVVAYKKIVEDLEHPYRGKNHAI